MSRVQILASLCVILWLAAPGSTHAAQCGSALLLEGAAPAVFDGVAPSAPTTARFWESGSAGTNGSGGDGCLPGCTQGVGAVCAGNGDCLALTGVNWLNATCAIAGHLPVRTVFLVEQPTTDTGGRWAAINFDTNATDANTDLDAKSSVVCGGCASEASPYLGDQGWPEVTASSVNGSTLAATLTWTAPPANAQALSNGSELVTSYSVFYRGHADTPTPSTGDPSGWTLVPDLQADGATNGGFSTDTGASVEFTVPGGVTVVTFAIGLNFDGSGNPMADPNTIPSAFLSDQSVPVEASNLIFADGFESGNTSAWSNVAP